MVYCCGTVPWLTDSLYVQYHIHREHKLKHRQAATPVCQTNGSIIMNTNLPTFPKISVGALLLPECILSIFKLFARNEEKDPTNSFTINHCI